MKRHPRLLLIISVTFVILTLAAFWTYRYVQRAIQNRVTLRVQNAPIAKVVADIARQTRETISVHPRLTGTVSVNAFNQPFEEVLDQIAEQCGGIWRTTFAIHQNTTPTHALRQMLARGESPDPSTWTNLSVRPPSPDRPGLPEDPPPPPTGGSPGGRRLLVMDIDDSQGPPPSHSRGEISRKTGNPDPADIRVERRGPGDGNTRVQAPRTASGARRMVVRAEVDGEGGGLVEFDLSPTRILLETVLLPKRPQPADFIASAHDAEQLAQEIRADLSRIHTVEPSPIPDLPPEVRTSLRRPPSESEGSDSPPRPFQTPEELGAQAERSIRQNQYDRLTRQTPEQRARQAARDTLDRVEENPPLTPRTESR